MSKLIKTFFMTFVVCVEVTPIAFAQTSTSTLNPSVTLGTVGKTSPYGPPPLTKLNPTTLLQQQQQKQQLQTLKNQPDQQKNDQQNVQTQQQNQ